jgi:WD40 repeat protein
MLRDVLGGAFDLNVLSWDDGDVLERVGRSGPTETMSATSSQALPILTHNGDCLFLFTTDNWFERANKTKSWFGPVRDEPITKGDTSRFAVFRIHVGRNHAFGALERQKDGLRLHEPGATISPNLGADELAAELQPILHQELSIPWDGVLAPREAGIETPQPSTNGTTEQNVESKNETATKERERAEKAQRKKERKAWWMYFFGFVLLLFFGPLYVLYLLGRLLAKGLHKYFSRPRTRRGGIIEVFAYALIPPVFALATYVFLSADGHQLAFDTDHADHEYDDPDDVYALRRGHDAAVTSIDFNAAGDLVATTGLDGVVRLWSGGGLLLDKVDAPFDGAQAAMFYTDAESQDDFLAVLSSRHVHQSRETGPATVFTPEDSDRDYIGSGDPDTVWASVSVPGLTPIPLSDLSDVFTVNSIVHGFGGTGHIPIEGGSLPIATFQDGMLYTFPDSQGFVLQVLGLDEIEETVVTLPSTMQPHKLALKETNGVAVGDSVFPNDVVVVTAEGHALVLEAEVTNEGYTLRPVRPLAPSAQTPARVDPSDIELNVAAEQLFDFSSQTNAEIVSIVEAGDVPILDEGLLVLMDDMSIYEWEWALFEGPVPFKLEEAISTIGPWNDMDHLVGTPDGRLFALDVFNQSLTQLGTAPGPFKDPFMVRNGGVYAISADEDAIYYWESAKGTLAPDAVVIRSPNPTDQLIYGLQQMPNSSDVIAHGRSPSAYFVLDGASIVQRSNISGLDTAGREIVTTPELAVIGDTTIAIGLATQGIGFVDLASAGVDRGGSPLPSSPVIRQVIGEFTTIDMAHDPRAGLLIALDPDGQLHVYQTNATGNSLFYRGILPLTAGSFDTFDDISIQFTLDGEQLLVFDRKSATAYSVSRILDAIESALSRPEEGEVVCRNCIAAGFADGTFTDEAGNARLADFFTLDGTGLVRRWLVSERGESVVSEPGYSLGAPPVFAVPLGDATTKVYAVVFDDHRIEFISPISGQRVMSTLTGFPAMPTALDYHPETKTFVVGTAEGTVHVFRRDRHERSKRYDYVYWMVETIQTWQSQ